MFFILGAHILMHPEINNTNTHTGMPETAVGDESMNEKINKKRIKNTEVYIEFVFYLQNVFSIEGADILMHPKMEVQRGTQGARRLTVAYS